MEGPRQIAETEMPGGFADTNPGFSVTSLRGIRGVGGGWWERRRWLIPIVSVALLAIILFTTAALVVRSRQPDLTFARVTQGNLAVSFQADGVIRSAVYGADFAVNGPVAEIDVIVGQRVSEGDTLAKLNTTLLQDTLKQAQAAADGASSALSSAQANQSKVQSAANSLVNNAYNTEQAAIKACEQQTPTPPNCVSQAKSAYSSALATAASMNAQAQQRTDEAQTQYNTAQAALQNAQDSLAAATLKAPHSGTIAAINGNVGQTSGGAKGGASFIEIADLSSLQITAMVDEAHVGAVQPRNIVRFTAPSFAGHTFSGTVSGVSPFGQAMHNTVYYPVTVDVDSQSVSAGNASANGQALLPGMTAHLTVLTAQRFAVKLVPGSAVTFAHAAANPKQYALISKTAATKALTEARQMLAQLQNSGADYSQDHPALAYLLAQVNGKWVAQPVVLGLTDGKNYEVLAGMTVGVKVATGEQLNWITILRNQ